VGYGASSSVTRARAALPARHRGGLHHPALPSLSGRAADLPRIVDEFALDAIAALGVPATSFHSADRDWGLAHAAGSLLDIEKATLRLVALRTSPNLSRAAARLGMAPVSLSRWLARHKLVAGGAVAG
jgi:hypothetical protein